MVAADLFFPFDKKSHVHRQRTGGANPGLNRFDMCEQLALVVRGPSSIDAAVANLWFERRRGPFLQRIRWLDIVVSVDQHRGPIAAFNAFTIDDRMPVCRNYLRRQPRLLHGIPYKRSTALHIVLKCRVGTDAGDAEKRKVFFERLVSGFRDDTDHIRIHKQRSLLCCKKDNGRRTDSQRAEPFDLADVCRRSVMS